jgi:hypothetical protein
MEYKHIENEGDEEDPLGDFFSQNENNADKDLQLLEIDFNKVLEESPSEAVPHSEEKPTEEADEYKHNPFHELQEPSPDPNPSQTQYTPGGSTFESKAFTILPQPSTLSHDSTTPTHPQPAHPLHQKQPQKTNTDYSMDLLLAKPWQLSYYKPYFNVNTQDILIKLKSALWPFTMNKEVFVKQFPCVELYGPLWILFTLSLFFAIFSHFYSIVGSGSKGKSSSLGRLQDFSMQKVPVTFAIVFGFFSMNSLISFAFAKFGRGDVRFEQILYVSGYALIGFIPMSVFYLVPFTISKVIVVGAFLVISFYFLYQNAIVIYSSFLPKWRYFIIVYISIALLIFAWLITSRIYT